MAAKKFKVWVKVFGEEDLVTNAMEYSSKEEAENAAADLAFRWTRVERYEIREIE